MNAQPDWDDLRIFLAVARQGSLSAAARSLAVNHSTVLRRINGLEAALGVRLFERLPAGYVATAAGEDLLSSAARIEEEVAGVGRRLSGRDVELRGPLRVTTIDILAIHVLPRHIAAFRAAYPKVRLELVIAETSFSLTRREADVAIRSTVKPPEALVGRAVSGLAFAIYGAKGYLEAAGPADDLARHAWVGLDDSFEHTTMNRWLRKHLPETEIGLRLNSVAAQLAAVQAGAGLAVLPCAIADPAPGLVQVRAPLADCASRIWLLTHADLRRMGRVRAFLDFMAAAFAEERDRLEGRMPETAGP